MDRMGEPIPMEKTMRTMRNTALVGGVLRATPAAGNRTGRFDRYLALVACAGAGGVGAAEAEATIVQSAPGWSSTATVSGLAGAVSKVDNFGSGGSPLAGFEVQAINFMARFVGFLGTYVTSTGNPVRFRQAMTNRLVAGDVVGASDVFVASGALVGSSASIVSSNFAKWVPATAGPWGALSGAAIRGYLGFRFSDNGVDVFYGYFDLEISRTGDDANSSLSVTVHGWAYNSIAGQSITIGSPSAIPGGAGLAALAFGAAGLRCRRRRR